MIFILINMAARVNISVEELKNNYTYKLVVKIIKRDYPWIKDIIPHEDINRFNVIFVDFIIDPFELSETTGWRLASYVLIKLRTLEPFSSPFLTTYFIDEPRKYIRELEENFINEMDEITTNDMIPHELRLPVSRETIRASEFVTPQDIIRKHAEEEG